ncbi:MAG: type II secretion system F family protein [Planctomycetaceae bacterium]|nr:type II secretion system F family protein [Planctomycetaceae bacterium]
MSPTLLIALAVFIGVAALVVAAAMFFRGDNENKLEDRLTTLTTKGLTSGGRPDKEQQTLLDLMNQGPSIFDSLLGYFGQVDLKQMCEQANVNLTSSQLLMMVGGLFAAGTALAAVAKVNLLLCPLAGLVLCVLPFLYLRFKKSRRVKAFGEQLHDSLDLMSRALRSGQSLGAAFDLVSQQLKDPVATEFGRVFETQNFGVPIEDALQEMTRRVPNLDLKFFATAVTLQRTTGGDLAEILDKIGYLVRERIKIWGQIAALTGEGRLSGVVLLGLPVVLFLAVYRLNPDYCMVLFTDPMGKQLLGGAIVMQIFGALVIRKIVNIKV